VLETLATLCRALKGAAIIVRLEGGLSQLTALIAHHIRRTTFQRAGFSCLAALAGSPQNAIAIAKAGAVQAVLVVLNDKENKYFGADSMEAATLGLQLLSTLIKSSDATLPLLGTQLILLAQIVKSTHMLATYSKRYWSIYWATDFEGFCQAIVNAIYARVGNKKVVTAATEVLHLVVKRYNSEDVSEV
jgi:hypothetical protein